MAGQQIQDQIQIHNATTLSSLEVGDMVEFPRGMYAHWGLYIGDGRIIHLSGGDNDGINAGMDRKHVFTICGRRFDKAFVRVDNFWDVVDNCKAKKQNRDKKYGTPESTEVILERAFSMIGEIGYNLIWENCEHFASFCRYGKKHSDQVETVAKGAALGAAAVMLGTLFLGWWRSGDKKKKHQDI